MPEKKAVKKAAKKAAKKAVKKSAKHEKNHHAGKDIRRAYEHMGRLEALQTGLPKGALVQVQALADMARTCLLKEDAKSAADLLRAGEHLSFGSLAGTAKESVSEELHEAITAQYEHLLEKAAEHWDEHDEEPVPALTAIYEGAIEAAETAYGKAAFRRALELARAAESLAHVEGIESVETLTEGASRGEKKKLKKG